LTVAEALQELRELLAHELSRAPGDIRWPLVRSMLWDVRFLHEDGYCKPLIELRIRRYKWRAGLRVV
jgi:hypothetical protein